MNSLNETFFNARPFSHIYVERQVQQHPETGRLLARFPKVKCVAIDHYKDVFCRSGQDYAVQHRSQKLILAARKEHFLYEGAPVCQDFGNRHFYYCSTMMNCIYDCEYCYLKGMYPSGNLVVFVNLEDYFEAIEQKLQEHPIYLCISYDSDLLAVEKLFGYCRRWAVFAGTHPELTLEIRTKSAGSDMWREMPRLDNVVYAFTMSPEQIVRESEHGTPGAAQRIACGAEGLRRGFPVRFCFDPMLYLPHWREAYGQLLAQIDTAFAGAGVSWEQLKDISVGTFRVSQNYYKKLRKSEPDSRVVQFPFQNVQGVYQYPPELLKQMEGWMVEQLSGRVPQQKIYHEFRRS